MNVIAAWIMLVGGHPTAATYPTQAACVAAARGMDRSARISGSPAPKFECKPKP